MPTRSAYPAYVPPAQEPATAIGAGSTPIETSPVPRRDSHAWFAVGGPDARACLAKLCGVDLRQRVFTNGAVAQCFLASISAILIRDDAIPAYHLLADSAAAGYLWDCLIDAMDEFDGGPSGRLAVGWGRRRRERRRGKAGTARGRG